MDLIKNVNWMSQSEKLKFKNSDCYNVITEFMKNYNIHESGIRAFRSLDTKRIEVLVSQFINRCAVREFEAFLRNYEVKQG